MKTSYSLTGVCGVRPTPAQGQGGASLPGEFRYHYDGHREQKDLWPHNQNLADCLILSVGITTA